MSLVKLYEMTSLTTSAVEVLSRSELELTIVYGDVQIDMKRESSEQPFIWKMGDLQLMTTGEADRPLPQFRPLQELVLAIKAQATYRKAA